MLLEWGDTATVSVTGCWFFYVDVGGLSMIWGSTVKRRSKRAIASQVERGIQ